MRKLEEPEYSRIWDAVDATFAFAPSTTSFPGFTVSGRSRTYAMMGDTYDLALLDELTARCNDMLRACTAPTDSLYWLLTEILREA